MIFICPQELNVESKRHLRSKFLDVDSHTRRLFLFKIRQTFRVSQLY